MGPFSPEGKAWLKSIDLERIARAQKVSGIDSDSVELSLRRWRRLQDDQSFLVGEGNTRGRQYSRGGSVEKALGSPTQGLGKTEIDRIRATVVKVFSEPKTASEP